MKVLALGRNEIFLAALKELVSTGRHKLVAAITARASPEYKCAAGDFESFAEINGIEFVETQRIDQKLQDRIAGWDPDVAISLNWVGILGAKIIGLFPNGVVNAHFGDLPRYRGNAVTNWALLAEESEIVLTLHQMRPDELDSGDILVQKRMSLAKETTIDDINCFAEAEVPSLFAQVLDQMEEGTLVPRRQEDSDLIPFRCYPRLPRDGRILWTQPATYINALVRSLVKPYTGAFTYYRDAEGELQKLHIWRTRVVMEETSDRGIPGHVIRNDSASGESWVYTGRGILGICGVSHGEAGKEFSPGRKWQSTRLRLGLDVEEEIMNLVCRVENNSKVLK